uniref:Uncharacterized protein n=1 Tax=Clytia hemisphaerica TaxID=252671 RepID=A0A7M5V584_9CNID
RFLYLDFHLQSTVCLKMKLFVFLVCITLSTAFFFGKEEEKEGSGSGSDSGSGSGSGSESGSGNSCEDEYKICHQKLQKKYKACEKIKSGWRRFICQMHVHQNKGHCWVEKKKCQWSY